MKRIVLISLVAALVAACQDSQLPTPPGTDVPDFALQDALHECTAGDPCEHFYFLPPLVPQPKRFGGEFNPYMLPRVEIRVLGDEDDPVCTNHSPVVDSFQSEIVVNPSNETYGFNWNSAESGLSTDLDYRLCVFIGRIQLGFRDLDPQESGADIARHPERQPLYEFRNGRTIPIDFRIEKGVLCNNDDDCGEGAVRAGEGGTVVTNTAFAGAYVAGTAANEDANLIVEGVTCPTTDGRVTYLPTDLPQVPGCYDVRTAEGDVDFGDPGALVGVCIDSTAARSAGLTEAQIGLLQLHHQRSSDGVVEALPNAHATFVDCGGFEGMASARNAFVQLARRTWGVVQRHMAPWFSPPPAFASHRGFGGYCHTCESPLTWALPAQFEIVDGTQDGAALVGEEREPAPEVRVRDIDGNPVAGATVGWRITEPTTGTLGSLDETGSTDPQCGSAPCFPSGSDAAGVRFVTGSDGRVSVGWLLGTNPNELEAVGAGIGLRFPAQGSYIGANRPPTLDESGPFALAHDSPLLDIVDLGIGVLPFTGTAYVNLYIPADGQPHGAAVWVDEDDNNAGDLLNDNFGPVRVCTDPAAEGVEITVVAFNNNGVPAELVVDDDGANKLFQITDITDADGCLELLDVSIDKTGAYRLQASSPMAASPATSRKFNIKPK